MLNEADRKWRPYTRGMFPDGEPHLQLDSVRIAQSGVAEMDGGRPLVFVPRADVVQVEAVYGVGAERPVIMLVLGLIMLTVGLWPVAMMVRGWTPGFILSAKAVTAVAFFLPAGWLLQLSVRTRWYLRVQQRRGSRKLLFARTQEQAAVEAFVAEARSRFGY